nr:MAG TPA: hypothetical protein [Caudoviricetes sp.]
MLEVSGMHQPVFDIEYRSCLLSLFTIIIYK